MEKDNEISEIVSEYKEYFGEASHYEENLKELADTVWARAQKHETYTQLKDIDLDILRALVRDLEKEMSYDYIHGQLNFLLRYFPKIDKIRDYIGMVEEK